MRGCSGYGILALVFVLFSLTIGCGSENLAQEGPNIHLKWRAAETVDLTACPVAEIETSEFDSYDADGLPSNLVSLEFSLYPREGDPLVVSVRVDSQCDATTETDCVAPGAGEYRLTQVPTGQNQKLEVRGYEFSDDSEKILAWSGFNMNVDVCDQSDPESCSSEPVAVEVSMHRVGSITKAFNCMENRTFLHQATKLRNGMILITGGVQQITSSTTSSCVGSVPSCDDMTAHSRVSLFDPGTGEFKEMTPLLRNRAGHVAVELNDGRVLIAGGASKVNLRWNLEGQAYFEPPSEGILKHAEIYDPAGDGTNILVQGSADSLSMIEARAFHTITQMDDEKKTFMIAGGFGQSTNGLARLSSIEIFQLLIQETSTGSISITPSFNKATTTMRVGRAWHTATKLADDRVFIYGGADPSAGEGNFPIIEIFTNGVSATEAYYPGEITAKILDDADGDSDDTTEDSGTTGNNSGLPNLYHHAAIAVESGTKVFVMGGFRKSMEGGSEVLTKPIKEAFLFDITNETYETLTPFFARAFSTLTMTPNGNVLVIGGAYDENDLPQVDKTQIVVYDPSLTARETFAGLKDYSRQVITMEPARMGHTATMLDDGSIFIVGGASPSAEQGKPQTTDIRSSGFLVFPRPDAYGEVSVND